MATSIATALKPTSPVSKKSPLCEAGISPGRLADLQEKFLNQIEKLHNLCDHGALTKEQYEKRKQVILDRLDELANS